MNKITLYEDCSENANCHAYSYATKAKVASQENGWDGTGPWIAYHLFDAEGHFIAGGWTK